MIGRALHHYEIVAQLGEGGMSRVYLANDSKLGRQVALKVLPIGGGRRPNELPMSDSEATAALERFVKEAQAIAALNHPNIVTLHSIEEADGIHFLTMEYISGQTLSQMIPARGLPLQVMVRLAQPLVSAVHAVHGRGIFHRDLKPENIMITEDGRLKVLDFGLAKLLHTAGDGDVSDDDEPQVAGTVHYMAPERLQGASGDERSDIFSLGAIFHQMTTGQRAFSGDTPMAVMSAILCRTPESLNEVKPELDQDWHRLVHRCLEKSPNDRFQSSIELFNEVRRLRVILDARTATPAHAGVSRGDLFERQVTLSKKTAFTAFTAFAVVASLLFLVAIGWWALNAWNPATPQAAAQDKGQRQKAPKRIAILPFKSLGNSGTEYFAAGISEEISSRLVTVPGLAVIPRAEVVRRINVEHPPTVIGQQLQADFVLQGTVLWDGAHGGRVRLICHLIQSSDGRTLWSEQFNRVLSDIFEVQSVIARQVIEQLDLTLFEVKRQELGSTRATDNLVAYKAYLKGLDRVRSFTFDDADTTAAVRLFQRAVDLDPNFADARCRLAYAHAARFHFGYDRSTARQAASSKALDRCLELDPQASLAQLTAGYVQYWVNKDYAAAVRHLGEAQRRRPGDPEVLKVLGFVQRRRGQFQAALDTFSSAAILSPADSDLLREIGFTLYFLRRYEEADREYDRAVELGSDPLFALESKVRNLVTGSADLTTARQVLDTMTEADVSLVLWHRFWLEIYSGQPEEALKHLRNSALERILWTHLDMPLSLLEGEALILMGQSRDAQIAYLQALEGIDSSLLESPEDPRLHAARAHALAGLNRFDAAIESARQAIELMPTARDAMLGPYYLQDLALIYTKAGKLRQAYDTVETLLAIPGPLSTANLVVDPRWQGLREHSRFAELLTPP